MVRGHSATSGQQHQQAGTLQRSVHYAPREVQSEIYGAYATKAPTSGENAIKTTASGGSAKELSYEENGRKELMYKENATKRPPLPPGQWYSDAQQQRHLTIDEQEEEENRYGAFLVNGQV